MATTFHSINIHYVFSTKNRLPMITLDLRDRLWGYMGGIANDKKMKALSIGGMPDHVHILVSLPTTLSVSKAIQLIKGGSSRWVHETFSTNGHFAWQDGYAAFSVSKSQISKVDTYIQNQEEHHRTLPFQEELRQLLEKHGIPYDERYMWV